ncbi:MAG TPA: M23 family metallopeptidase [Fimbriimonas sp.]|nr:M23 family metallopeptidase [Fimbriimonas sp.]
MSVLFIASTGYVVASKGKRGFKSVTRLRLGLQSVRDAERKALDRLTALDKRETVLKGLAGGTTSVSRDALELKEVLRSVEDQSHTSLTKTLVGLHGKGYSRVLAHIAGFDGSASASQVRNALARFDSVDEVNRALTQAAKAGRSEEFAAKELKKIAVERKALLMKVEECEINEEQILAEIKQIRTTEETQQSPNAKLRSPVAFKVTSKFGMRMHPIAKCMKLHKGLDLAGDTGDTVKSAEGGKVTFAGQQSGYGNIIIIQHDNDLSTAYAHLSEIDVEEGQEVRRGEPIGKVGATGNVTGAHLHFEVRVNGNHVDPADYL